MARSCSVPVRSPSRRRKSDPLPTRIKPMLALSAELPHDLDNYTFEWKWDAVRALCYCDSKRMHLESRNQIDITSRYPALHDLYAAMDGHRAILDGEIIAFDSAGRPSFTLLQRRMHVNDPPPSLCAQVPIWYVLFDILYVDGVSLMDCPYTDRRARLEELTIAGPHWQITSSHIGEGEAMLAAARANCLEGIIAKRLDSIYEPGRRSPAWKKIKVIQRQEFVLGGYIPEENGITGRIGSM